ncbi:MAG: penicillin-binding protein activator LpoB [Elusimicrobiota bacterium]
MDLSGKWNDTDSKLVSEEMIKDCLSRPWIDQFQLSSSKRPTVIVGTVVNKTDEHIISETFTKDLERAFINSGRVQLVASREERTEVRQERVDMQEHASAETRKQMQSEKASDFMLKGVINSIIDKEKKKKIIYYQIDLELINNETNQKTWIGDKKIKKYIH